MSHTLYEMKEINSKNLSIPRELYQRDERKRKIERIVADFDERVANEPKVSYRDGEYYVFDGQHTILAREQIEGENTPILCKVYKGLTAQEEARLFAMQTGASSKPTSGAILRAKVYSGDPDSIAFFNATEDTGIYIALTGDRYDGHLTCINTAMYEFRRLGEQRYKEAMTIIFESWGGMSDSLRHEIIKAVCEFVLLYHDQYSRQRLINRLAKTDPLVIIQNIHADMDTPSHKKYLFQIFKVYNGNSKKTGLPKLF